MPETYNAARNTSVVPKLDSLVVSQQLKVPLLMHLFEQAEAIRRMEFDPDGVRTLRHMFTYKKLFSLFWEPSTRTSYSTRVAALNLGMEYVHTDMAGEYSSGAKGETLADTIKTFCELRPSIIAMRHKVPGSAEEAAKVAKEYGIPVINAGDGGNQHPTQAALDMYTIWRHFKKFEGLTYVIGGDPANSRTERSLAYLLSKFENVKLIFVSAPELRMKPDLLCHLDEKGVKYEFEENMRAALEQADVVYWVRNQVERLERGAEAYMSTPYRITPAEMLVMKKDAILMHPLPRCGIKPELCELTPECDSDPRSVYLREQVPNGLWMRMAVICHLLGKQVHWKSR